MNWVTVVDHSFDLNDKIDRWNEYVTDCNSNLRCLVSEEISCENGILQFSHYLGYNIKYSLDGDDYELKGSFPCDYVIGNVSAQGGFGYAAHPTSLDRGWQNYSLPFTGLEIWNGEENIAELDSGLEKWRALLLSGRKVFIEAGSDSHGDFNSALGKVRTACFAQSFTKDNIFTALKNGNCMMTDGPFVIFTANKHILGESFNVLEGNTVLLNISWSSTKEFGNVTKIILIRGEINGNEINETIIAPNNLSGNVILPSTPNNTYYRIEAKSTDSEGKIRRAYTNPIWVRAEPRPEIEKIPMDETEHALITTFEEKYNTSLKDLYFDGNDSTTMCNSDDLQNALNLSNSNYWKLVRCEKTYSNITRVMWAGFNNLNTSEKKIILQIGNLLQFANATYNPFVKNWANCCSAPYYGTYRNNNWIANKNGKEIFEINEVSNSNWAGSGYFGTYLIHGFKKYDGNTAVYYTHWGTTYIPAYNIHDVWINFDNSPNYPLAWEGFYFPGTRPTNFNRGVFHERIFNYNASSFKLGADGEYLAFGNYEVDGTSFDASNRSIFPVSQTDSIVRCHADIDCKAGNIRTKYICANKGTVSSYCTSEYLLIELGSPAHISVTDAEGRITGYVNVTYLTEIPDSEILDTMHEKYRLPAGNYKISVEGYETGNYSLKVTFSSNESAGMLYFQNISASNETSDSFELNGTQVSIKTNDLEKSVYFDIETVDGSKELNFTISQGLSANILFNCSNVTYTSVTLSQSNHPPQITSLYPNNNSAFAQWKIIPISVNATDEDNDTIKYWIIFDGLEISNGNKANYALADSGNHMIMFNVSDGLASDVREIVISVIAPPAVTIHSPENITYNSTNVFLRASISGEMINASWISVDGLPWQEYTSSTSNITLDIGSMSDGAHNLQIHANNMLGGLTISTVYFTIDTAPPNIIIASPEEREYLHDDSITLKFSATDALSGVDSINAVLDNLSVTDGQTIELRTLSIGNHALIVSADDMAGNTAIKSVMFTIKPLAATVDVDPDTLNRASKSNRNAVTAYIEIPNHDVNAIDISSVILSTSKGNISAQISPTAIGDYDSDGIPDRMIKFERQKLMAIIGDEDRATLTISGRIAGVVFEGRDEIKVIH